MHCTGLFRCKKFNAEWIDVEDYHPGEGKDKLVQQLPKLMTEYLPKMDMSLLQHHLCGSMQRILGLRVRTGRSF